MINVIQVLIKAYSFFYQALFLAFPILAAYIFVSEQYKGESNSNLEVLANFALSSFIFAACVPILLFPVVFLMLTKMMQGDKSLDSFVMLSALLIAMTVKLPILTVLLAINMIQTKLFADSDNAWVRNLVIAGYVCSAGLGVYATVAKESMIMLNAQRLIGPKVAQAATFISAKVYANTHNNSCSSPR